MLAGSRLSDYGTALHPAIKATPLHGRAKQKRCSYISGFNSQVKFAVLDHCFTNALRSVNERVFYVKDKTTGQLRRPVVPDLNHPNWRLMAKFKTSLAKRIKTTTPYNLVNIPDLYVGRKKTIYANAVESLLVTPWCPKDATIRSFLKAEPYSLASKSLDQIVNRVISPASPRHNASVAKFTKKIEHSLYHTIDKVVHSLSGCTNYSHTIMKGYNSSQMAANIIKAWESFNDPVAVGFDATRFDQHVSQAMLRWEHSVYALFFHGHDKEELNALMREQLRVQATMYLKDGRIKYATKGTRCSGHMNTGMGNCLIMVAMTAGFCKTLNIKKFKIINNGDDCVLIVERTHLHKLTQNQFDSYFHPLGFDIIMEQPVDVVERIEFCQMHPVNVDGHWLMVRNVIPSATKDAISIRPLRTDKEISSWMLGVGEAGLSLTGGVPIVQEYYTAFTKAAHSLVKSPTRNKHNQLDENGFYYLRQGMTRKYNPVTDSTRVSFYRAFNILPTEQEYIESVLKQMALTRDSSNHMYIHSQ